MTDIITAAGPTKTVTFDGRTVCITRKFAPSATTIRIPADTITSVELTEPAFLIAGAIRFTYAGMVAPQRRQSTKQMLKDDNVVLFNKNQLAEFQAVRDAIEAARRAPAAPAELSVADRLRQLSSLHDGGLITDAEFEAKRGELVAQL